MALVEAIRRVPWLTILRWIAFSIGALLLVVEIYDALVTPGPDWFWFAVALLQMWVCRPRKMAARTVAVAEAG
ncbi:hypothetical protein ACSBM8_00765 [Sphingomonas sp. ASY06-1R]|jgi:hypothetical protein|uniref:hypothetical protein n=1 Tax=Sphingomonas sp. ASY06-1R TaxID=3445771 RepID=UPI003FA31176